MEEKGVDCVRRRGHLGKIKRKKQVQGGGRINFNRYEKLKAFKHLWCDNLSNPLKPSPIPLMLTYPSPIAFYTCKRTLGSVDRGTKQALNSWIVVKLYLSCSIIYHIQDDNLAIENLFRTHSIYFCGYSLVEFLTNFINVRRYPYVSIDIY